MGEGWKRGVACGVWPKPGTRAGKLGFRAGLGAFTPSPQQGWLSLGQLLPMQSPAWSWVFMCFLRLSAPSINTRLLQGRESAAARLGSAGSDRALGVAVVYLTVVPLPARSSVTPSQRWLRAFHLAWGNVFFTLSIQPQGLLRWSRCSSPVISLVPCATGGLHLEVPPA